MKEQTQYVEEAPGLIKNTVVERIFWDDATPRQKEVYVNVATNGKEHATARATAYASRTAEVWHRYRKDRERRLGIDHEYQAFVLFERDKGKRAT